MRQHIILMIFTLLLVMTWSAFSSQELERIDNSAFENPRRPGAVFVHDEHNEKAGLEDNCVVCHHVYENKVLVKDESSEDQSCSECHGLEPSLENKMPLEPAFHNRCKNCHFESGKGPVLCGQCHVKK